MTIDKKREALKERFSKYPLIDLSGENRLNDPAYQAYIIDNAPDEAIDKVCQLIDAVEGLWEIAHNPEGTRKTEGAKMTRKEILEAAIKTVCADRQDQYGEPERNLGNIAAMWSTYLGTEIVSKDVAAMMALLKICRIATGKPKTDNWIDLAGYAAIGAEAEEATTDD